MAKDAPAYCHGAVGDGLRTAFGKVNDNFTELYNETATSVGTGASMIALAPSSASRRA